MNKFPLSRRNMYYTQDHEWIDYHGSVAYVGVCEFKLKGFKEVHQIAFRKDYEFLEQGEIIATIHYQDYRVLVHMPVNGKIISLNEKLQTEVDYLISDPEKDGWIASIAPIKPYERTGLLNPEQYRIQNKGYFQIKD